MASLNKVMIIGNLGKDPEMRYTPAGLPVANFTVAVNRRTRGRDGGEGRDETEWFNVVAFDKLAETCNQYLQKGKQVFIEGRLQTRTWDDQQGQKHSRTEVIARDMVMLGSRDRQAEAAGTAGEDEYNLPPPGPEDKEDDLPF